MHSKQIVIRGGKDHVAGFAAMLSGVRIRFFLASGRPEKAGQVATR